MCMSKPKMPPPPPPAPPKPVVETPKLAPEVGGRTTKRDQNNSKRSGRSGLRIDLNSANIGGAGTGLNVPAG